MPERRWPKYLPFIAGVVVLVAAVTIAFLFKNLFLDKQPERKKVVQQVTLITPPPPPPEPPPPEEPEVQEPEEVVEEVMEESMPEELGDSSSEDLGIDAEGTAGGDSFGLVGRKGGRGIVGGGYAAVVQQTIVDLLTEDPELKTRQYTTIVELWIDGDGILERYNIVQHSGDPDTKELLQIAFSKIDHFRQGPPLEMPQPIKLRLKSRF